MAGADPVSFTLADRTAAYGRMGDSLRQFGYRTLPRSDRGILRQSLASAQLVRS